ncbi:hypothetical protein HanRHA438_Chr03g0128611 [Helianthus annuus]|nr:hypothetical protein HanHA300_Chr03g0097481 [Helianthus annuus]KAJ0608496.1 hypothetical protein HanHA89_Chr03g0109181 [Helianthus annuus]KAJ0768560.1 hypothetical protein HanLR1_Chr03g0102551 [Helianthus annuus]KAJ0936235.1 hypothetical protein HanRHA438_Chr03g0128461 [Helianthus annuus]KAJ0936249.1 hypothetical protein HanRHA438_Chr03g0128611 [Helianthus annuus]
MRVSTNASGLGFATRSAVFDGFLLALIRSLILLMCNQARSLILLHRRLCLIHIKNGMCTWLKDKFVCSFMCISSDYAISKCRLLI